MQGQTQTVKKKKKRTIEEETTEVFLEEELSMDRKVST